MKTGIRNTFVLLWIVSLAAVILLQLRAGFFVVGFILLTVAFLFGAIVGALLNMTNK